MSDNDLTDEEMDALDKKLASQIGDDVQIIFDHEQLFKQARSVITALRTQLAEVQAEKEKLGRDVNTARYGQPDFSWQLHKEALAEAIARADRAEAARATLVEEAAGIVEAELKLWGRGYDTTPEGYTATRVLEIVRDAISALTTDRERDALAKVRAEAMREAAGKATSFLVGDPQNGIPLRKPMAHEVADAILARAEQIEKGEL